MYNRGMKNKTLVMAVLVSAVSIVVFLGQYTPKSYARDGGGSTENSDSVRETEANSPTETPEIRSEDRKSLATSPLSTPLAKPKDASEQQVRAIEKINEAQSKFNELTRKLAREINPVPQNVQQLVDLAGQKLADAKTALSNQDFGNAFGQAQAAESLIKNTLRSLENEHEAEKVQEDLNKEIEDESIDSVEFDSVASESGSIKIEHKDKSHTTRSVPFSSTPLFEIQTGEGTIGAHIASGSRAVIDNEDLNIESDFPLILNIASKTFSVRTSSGVHEIKTLPAKAFAKVDKQDKPDSLDKVSLKEEGGQLVFQADGAQSGKILGLIPLTFSVKTTIDTQTGAVISVDKPWFMILLGPFFR